ncbi:MAG: hypothetical protein BWZ10_03380 [candidate division BRC1 bacterium ADurb.BinA364]|nr:MAG: hypothetical protein BWZ10_03380 [candidate division BRC1 bacterium ADurb.BinA364]
MVGQNQCRPLGPCRVAQPPDSRVEPPIDRLDRAAQRRGPARIMPRRRGIVVKPIVMRNGVGFAEERHETIPWLLRKQPFGHGDLLLQIVEQRGQGLRMPAAADARFLERRHGVESAKPPNDDIVQFDRMNERRADARSQRRIESADLKAVKGFRGIRRRQIHGPDAPSASAQQSKDRWRAAVPGVGEFDGVAPRPFSREIEQSVASGIGAGHEGCPCRKRRGRNRRSQWAE